MDVQISKNNFECRTKEIELEGQSQEVLESIICPICTLILPMPHFSCIGCSNTICPTCLKSWLEKQPEKCIFGCKEINFQEIKRSNTYNALMEIFKMKCKHCNEKVAISRIVYHEEKECMERIVFCSFVQCKLEFKQKEIKSHELECMWRLVECEKCKKEVIFKEMEIHLNEKCEINIKPCIYIDCKEIITAKESKSHILNCTERELQCKFCFLKMKAIEEKKHLEICIERVENCELCGETVQVKENSKHKSVCLWKTVCELKNISIIHSEENEKLKEKVKLLELIIKETENEREFKVMTTIKEIKQREKAEYEKDLQRIVYSMNSLEKHKKEETESHFHFSEKLCLTCIRIKHKHQELLEPLDKKREEILEKLALYDRDYITPRN